MCVAYFAHHHRSTRRRGALAKMEPPHQHCSNVIRRRVAVASATLEPGAGVGSAEARRAGANGARIEAPRFGSEGRNRSSDQGSEQGVRRLGDVHCHFIAPALSRKHLASASAIRVVLLSIPISRLFLRSEAHALNKEY